MKIKSCSRSSLTKLDLTESQLYALFLGQKLIINIDDKTICLGCEKSELARSMYDGKRADQSDI